MSDRPSTDVVTPEQYLEHIRRHDKKLVVVVCDSPHIPTGQASYMRGLLANLHPNDDWDIVQFAWFHQLPQKPSKWPLITTTRNTEEPTVIDMTDRFGQKSLRPVLETLKPDLVYSMGDPHMIEPIIEAKKDLKFRFLWHVMVDGFPLHQKWEILKDVDGIIPATQWAKNKLITHCKANGIPVERILEPIGYPVDLQRYAPNLEIRKAIRGEILAQAYPPVPPEKLDDTVVLVTVARNQFRKGLQFGLEAFSAVRKGEYGVCKQCGYVTVPPLDYHADGFLGKSPKVVSEFCRGCGQNDWRVGEKHPDLYYYWHVPVHDSTFSSYDIKHMFRQMGLYAREGKLDGILLVQNRSGLEGVSEDDMIRTYLMSDIFMLPTLGEGFGCPCVEAMACGLPALVTRCTSQQEVVGNDSLTVPPERYIWEAPVNYPRPIPDLNELTRQLLHLVENKEERKYLGEYCLKRSAMYRKEMIGQQFKELLDRELLKSNVKSWQFLSEGL